MKVSAIHVALFAATLHASTSQAAEDEEAPLPPATREQPEDLESGARDAQEAAQEAPSWLEPKLVLHGS